MDVFAICQFLLKVLNVAIWEGYLYAFQLVCKVCKKVMLVSILCFPIS